MFEVIFLDAILVGVIADIRTQKSPLDLNSLYKWFKMQDKGTVFNCNVLFLFLPYYVKRRTYRDFNNFHALTLR